MYMRTGNAVMSIEFLASPSKKKSDTPDPLILGPNCFDLFRGDKINAEIYIGSLPGYLPEAYLLAKGAGGKKHYFELKSFHMLCDVVYDGYEDEFEKVRMFTLFDKYKHLVVIDKFYLSLPDKDWVARPLVPDTPEGNAPIPPSDNKRKRKSSTSEPDIPVEDDATPSIIDKDVAEDITELGVPSDDTESSVTEDDSPVAEEE